MNLLLSRPSASDTVRPLPLPTPLPLPRSIEVRELTSADGADIEALFAGLSDQDRYYRFFRPMPSYPTPLLELLTGMDGVDHIAVGAFDGDRCIGVGRFIRTSRRPTVAEVALTVSADHRGRGVARRMMDSLDALAPARGVDHFEIMVHPTNRRAAKLFRSLGFVLTFDDGALVSERPVGGHGVLTTERELIAA